MATKTKKVRTKPRSKRTKTAHLPGFEPSDEIPEVTIVGINRSPILCE